jgi:prophage antirepressor-like protein
VNALAVFEYADKAQVRVVRDDKGDPWFVAADVCKVLELNDTSRAVSRLDEDEKGTTTIRTLGGNQDVLTVSEPGLYSLIGTSRKPEAKAFRRWINHDVLPSLRANGSYSLQKLSPAKALLAQVQQLVDHEERIAALEAKTSAIESSTDYFSVLAWARLKGFPVDNVTASRVGKAASAISRERGMMVGKLVDPRFGSVNSYHRDVLAAAFLQVFFK